MILHDYARLRRSLCYYPVLTRALQYYDEAIRLLRTAVRRETIPD